MQNSKPYDPRVIANLILDDCELAGIEVTNLKLQKLLYFCHATYLTRTGAPLISPGFQAWPLGPVNRLTYNCFKHSNNKPISDRAMRWDEEHKESILCDAYIPVDTLTEIRGCLTLYRDVAAGRLVDLSHTEGGPWDHVWQSAKTKVNIGLQISDELIFKYFVPRSTN